MSRREKWIVALLGILNLAALFFSQAHQPPSAVDPPPAIAAEQYSGGETTVFNAGRNAFGMPLANISRENRRAHVVGNSFFNLNWVIAPASTTARDGLGPLFHARSCSACHLHDGRGAPPGPGELMTSLLFRLSEPGEKTAHGAPMPHPTLGSQLGVRAIPGATPEGNVEISYEEVPGAYPDGTTYSLRKPHYQLVAEGLAEGSPIEMSPRIAPAVFGVGLLEAIPEETILSHADPEDRDDDGISGRPNTVWDVASAAPALGRFGWKANEPNVRQQTASAFLGDIGITTSLFPEEALTPDQRQAWPSIATGAEVEIEDRLLQRVVDYQRTLAPPGRRDVDHLTVRRGRELFNSANCSACHIPSMKTGVVKDIPELSDQLIWPYTDLLLHDMGPDLADGRPDFEASGSEWRTPPLWGIGLVEEVNGHTNFLHDGRARNLEEAILWHGGEAKASRESFKAMALEDREALLAFLESL